MNAFSGGKRHVTFNDAVNMVHDVIRTCNPFPNAAQFMFVGFRNNKLNKSDVEMSIECVQSVAVHKKISNSVGINDNFLAKARKLSFIPTLLDIFGIRHYIRIRYVSFNINFTVYTAIIIVPSPI